MKSKENYILKLYHVIIYIYIYKIHKTICAYKNREVKAVKTKTLITYSASAQKKPLKHCFFQITDK